MAVNIGVLAFQGAFSEHEFCLQKAFKERQNGPKSKDFKARQLNVKKVKKEEDLEDLQGLIIPGGESTTMAKFLDRNGFNNAILHWIEGNDRGKPWVWGTCAGLILLANKLEDVKYGGQTKIGGIDITATRNRYGRQCESFEIAVDLKEPRLYTTGNTGNVTEKSNYHGVFIRAPGIKSVDDPKTKVLASYQDKGKEKIVAVQQGHLVATTFHPELTDDLRWHTYFLDLIIS